jgi:hypothetical protein
MQLIPATRCRISIVQSLGTCCSKKKHSLDQSTKWQEPNKQQGRALEGKHHARVLNQKLEEVHCSPKRRTQITFPPATPPSARFNVGLLGDSGVGKTAFLEAMAADREECEAVGLNAFTVPLQSDTVGLVHLIAYDFSGMSVWRREQG